jgi:hypothetical protein
MPHCTVRYHVRLVPKQRDAQAMDAVGIFIEERMPNEAGEPGVMLSRWLDGFSGPSGVALRTLVGRDDAWDMDVQHRIGPLEWDA